jgi:hypothetical protein
MAPPPAITITPTNPTYGDQIQITVVYDPLSIPFTATAPNGEQSTATLVFKVALNAPAVVLNRVSDDGHTAVFTATMP